MPQGQFNHFPDFMGNLFYSPYVLISNSRYSSFFQFHGFGQLGQYFQFSYITYLHYACWVSSGYNKPCLSWEWCEKELVKIKTEEVFKETGSFPFFGNNRRRNKNISLYHGSHENI